MTQIRKFSGQRHSR